MSLMKSLAHICVGNYYGENAANLLLYVNKASNIYWAWITLSNKTSNSWRRQILNMHKLNENNPLQLTFESHTERNRAQTESNNAVHPV